MPDPMTDYDPDGYNRDSFANIMQFIFADLMIRYEREGLVAFWETKAEVRQLRFAIQTAYESQMEGKDPVLVQQVAEGVLLWLREGATVDDVLKAPKLALIIRAKRVRRK